MVNSEEIEVGFEPKPISRSYPGDSSADRSLSGLIHSPGDLNNQFKNLGLNEVTKEQSEMMMSVSESVSETNAVDTNQEEDGYGDGWSEKESDEKREIVYPVRPGTEDCSFYMRTGSCKFGSSCKFNHPLLPKIQYFFRTGGCKHGETCGFDHTKPNSCLASVPELNILGLPIRPGEVECAYYMCNASCKFGAECKFNHPDPTTIAETDSPSFPAEEFPERPDQPECSYYIKTGDCKFKFTCKYHHPKNRLPKQPPYAFNDKGLPLRPDENICSHYSQYGICKFGPACKFDHSVQLPSTGSSLAVVEPIQVGGNGNESDGWN